jgi:ketosteroid isomerase-like protein
MPAADLIRAHYDAAGRGDIEGILAPLADDVAWTEAGSLPYAGTYNGPAEVAKGVFARLGGEWEDFRFEPEEIVDGGSTVVSVGTYSGVFRDTGRAMTARVAHVWHVRDDKVVRFEQIVDSVPFLAAIEGE